MIKKIWANLKLRAAGRVGNSGGRAGFTLVEVLIVMVIIGIVSTIGFGSFQTSQIKSRDAARKSDLKQIANALEVYYNDRGSYPLSINTMIGGCNGGSVCGWGEAFVDENGTTYMVKIPLDPIATRSYYYWSDGTAFQIYALLENVLDRDVKLVGGSPGEYDGLECGMADMCNYGISSPNTTPEENRVLVAI